ncbi:MAG: FAD:protein FMN transferase [Planctomycetota bacterium]|nr:FAD:protein FMN transferase [Planctomycetota bacterium]
MGNALKLALLGLGLAGSLGCAAPRLERHEYEDAAMGTQFRIVLYAESREVADAAAQAAFARVHELDARLSDYREESELSRLSAASGDGELHAVSEDLWRVLSLALEVAEESEGAFDVTAGPVIGLWRRARRQGELPDEARLAKALEATGWRHVRLDPWARSVELRRPGMKLDFGGIAKGYALDAALDVLAEHAIERALVDGGGDVAVRRAPPGERGWRVEIRPLGDETASVALVLENAAVATSGDAFQALVVDGVHHSHIVDPRTGRALSTRASASVVARDGALSDALATAACVLGPERGLALCERRGAEVRVMLENSGASEGPRVESRETPGFRALILHASGPLPPP